MTLELLRSSIRSESPSHDESIGGASNNLSEIRVEDGLGHFVFVSSEGPKHLGVFLRLELVVGVHV